MPRVAWISYLLHVTTIVNVIIIIMLIMPYKYLLIIIIIVDEERGELPNLHLGIQTSHHSYKCANFTTEHCSDTFIKEDCKHINDSAGI